MYMMEKETYFKDVLVFSVVAKGIFAPSSGPAAAAAVVCLGVRQACGTDVRGLLEVNRLVHA